jgi:hypothetical protein
VTADAFVEDEELPGWLDGIGIPADEADLRALGEVYLTYHRLALREAAQLRKLSRLGKVPVARVPLMDEGIGDVEGLRLIAEALQAG